MRCGMIRRLLSMALAAICLAGAAVLPARPPKSMGQANTAIPVASSDPARCCATTRVALPALYRAKAWRIVYITRDYRMKPILSTGIVVLPDKAVRADSERQFVAWAHPTTGIARKCAPSLRASPTKAIEGLNELVAAGLVVTATDYPGLGTEGPIGYLVGPGQAYAVIDSVRAAQQIPGLGTGRNYALWGYSQGGHAALFAADLSRRYAPELNLMGVAAVAPPTSLDALLRANLNTVPGRILASFTLSSWSRKYGAPLGPLVDVQAARVVEEVGKSCIDDLGGKLDALAAQKGLEQRFLKADPGKIKPWSGLMLENSKFSLAARVPTLIIQGDADDIVRPEITQAFVRASCRVGVPVRYVVLKRKGHAGAIKDGAKQATNWIAAQMAGRTIPSNCR